MADVTYGEELAEDEVLEAPQAKGKYVLPAEDEAHSNSLLDELAEVAAKEFTNTCRLEVNPELRPGGWVLEFDATLDAADIRRYQRAATNNGKKKAEDADSVKANAMALLEKNTGIFKGDTRVNDSDGDPLLLTSAEWLTKVAKQRESSFDTIAALKKFLGDAQVISMGAALMRKAGYGDEMTPLDPT